MFMCWFGAGIVGRRRYQGGMVDKIADRGAEMIGVGLRWTENLPMIWA